VAQLFAVARISGSQSGCFTRFLNGRLRAEISAEARGFLTNRVMLALVVLACVLGVSSAFRMAATSAVRPNRVTASQKLRSSVSISSHGVL
jgi:hypothetical protein